MSRGVSHARSSSSSVSSVSAEASFRRPTSEASPSAMRSCRRTISARGAKAVPAPDHGVRAASHTTTSWRSVTRRPSSRTSCVLPTPGTPITETRRLRRVRRAVPNAALSSLSSRSRPMSGGSGARFAPGPTGRMARQLWTGADFPFSRCLPAGRAMMLVRSQVGWRHSSSRAWFGGGLQAGGDVHDVPGHHALALAAEHDRRLAGGHRGARLQRLAHTGRRSSGTAATISRADRTARSASSSSRPGCPRRPLRHRR